MSNERRQHQRVSIRRGQARARVIPRSPELLLSDLSAGGGGLYLPSGMQEPSWEVPLTFHLDHFPPFQARAVPVPHLSARTPARQVGFFFREIDRGALASLSSFLVSQSLEESQQISLLSRSNERMLKITDAGMIRRLLRYHGITCCRPIQAYEDRVRLDVRLALRDISTDGKAEVLVLHAPADPGAALRQGREYTFVLQGDRALTLFDAVVQRITPEAILIALPTELRQLGFRSSVRIRLDPETALDIVLHHPQLPDGALSRPLFDIGACGLSFLFRPGADLLFPGEHFEEVTLELPAGPVRLEAVMRGLFRRKTPGRLGYGLEILRHFSEEEAERWHRFVLGLGHPNLCLGTRELVPAAWGLLESSGYLEEVSSALRSETARSFFFSWDRHIENPSVARLVLLSRRGRPTGTMAASLLYPRTWLIHHLGIDPKNEDGEPEGLLEAAKEIYSAMTYVLQHMTPLDYFVLYVNAKKAWNRMLYARFLAAYPRPDDYLYDRFALFRHVVEPQEAMAGEEEAPEAEDEDLEVIRATPDLLRGLSCHLVATLPAIEVAAYAYEKDTIDLASFSRDCETQGYERRRSVFFAFARGIPVAALIAETGEEGVNAFNLLNRCWLIWLKLDPRWEGSARGRLLRVAALFYAESKKREFVFLHHFICPDLEVLARLGYHYQVDVFRWLAHRVLLSSYIGYIEQLLEIFRG